VQTYAAAEYTFFVQLACSASSEMLPKVSMSCCETAAQVVMMTVEQDIYLVSRFLVFCLSRISVRNLSYSQDLTVIQIS